MHGSNAMRFSGARGYPVSLGPGPRFYLAPLMGASPISWGAVQCRGRSPDPRPGLPLGGTSVTRDALRRHGGRVGGEFGAEVHGIREDAAPTGSAAQP